MVKFLQIPHQYKVRHREACRRHIDKIFADQKRLDEHRIVQT